MLLDAPVRWNGAGLILPNAPLARRISPAPPYRFGALVIDECCMTELAIWKTVVDLWFDAAI